MPVAEAELQRFLTQRTPRPLTPGIRADRLPLLPLAAVLAALIASCALTVVIALQTFPAGILEDLRLEFSETAVATGEVTGIAATEFDVVDPNDVTRILRVHRVDFAFSDASGEPQSGSSFARSEAPTPGRPINIQYLLEDPSIARVQGTSRSPTPRRGALVLLLPLPALALLIVVIVRRHRTWQLLTYGVNTRARVVDVVDSPSLFGQKRICVALSFRDGRSTVIEVPSKRADARAILERAAVGEMVPVLRDLVKPSRMLLIDRMRRDPVAQVDRFDGVDEFGEPVDSKVRNDFAKTR